MPDEEEYKEKLLDVMVNAEGKTAYGPVVNFNGMPIDKNSAQGYV